MKEFIHRLQQSAELQGCTVLLLSSRENRAAAGEEIDLQTTVDGLIDLSRQRRGVRVVRELEVVKLRGSNYLPGPHVLDITATGLTVYPRTEVLLTAPAGGGPPAAASRERTAFGIPPLDAMLQGGVFCGSTTALLGPSGSGKTILGLLFLAEGTRRGEAALYFGLNEPPPVLIDAGEQIGLPFTRLVAAGQIEVVWQMATEVALDVLAQELLARVQARAIRRIFIDGLDAFRDLNLYAERLAPFFSALTTELRARGVTTLVSVELPYLFGPTVELPIQGLSALVENIIFLRYVELRSHLYRLISVLKTRRSGHDPALRQFTISATGITIASTFESAEAILTGVARSVPSGALGSAYPVWSDPPAPARAEPPAART